MMPALHPSASAVLDVHVRRDRHESEEHMLGRVSLQAIVGCASILGAFTAVHRASSGIVGFDGQRRDHNFYVSMQGSDAAPGSLTRPWRTIQHAVDSIVAGDTANVRGGVYLEAVDIRTSGSSAGGGITLRS
jgi:hypothetical protein